LSLDIEKNDKRVAYFRQAENGLFIRMALLKMLLE
jgi:aspartate carbamoyltransferase catalytic subunit